jgi:hypothetical protein
MKVIISHSSTDNLKKYGDQLMMDYFDDMKKFINMLSFKFHIISLLFDSSSKTIRSKLLQAT